MLSLTKVKQYLGNQSSSKIVQKVCQMHMRSTSIPGQVIFDRILFLMKHV